MATQTFFLKLLGPRPTFPMDMTASEKALMLEHVAYMEKLFEAKKVIVYGPVMDSQGPYGMGVFVVEGEAELRALMAEDPTIKAGMNTFEVSPMRVGRAQGMPAA